MDVEQERLTFINTIGSGFALPTYRGLDAKALSLSIAAANYCTTPILQAVVSDLETNLAVIAERWETSVGDFIGTWNTSGSVSNTTYPQVQDVIDEPLTQMEFVLDNLKDVKRDDVLAPGRDRTDARQGRGLAQWTLQGEHVRQHRGREEGLRR